MELEELWRNPEDQTIQGDALQLMNVWYSCRAQRNLPRNTPRNEQEGYVRIVIISYKGVSQSEGAWSPLN